METEWKVTAEPVNYLKAVEFMENRVASICQGEKSDLVWLLEHPHLYTAGTSAQNQDLLRDDIPVFKSGRGGQYTYHGPGQRIAYVMLDLKKRNNDIRKYIFDLEEWIILTLAEFDIKGERRSERVGIWVCDKETENKIAAIGVRVRKGISYHGIAVNFKPDLSYYNGIVPCGIREYGVTSIEKLGIKISAKALDNALQEKWKEVFK